MMPPRKIRKNTKCCLFHQHQQLSLQLHHEKNKNIFLRSPKTSVSTFPTHPRKRVKHGEFCPPNVHLWSKAFLHHSISTSCLGTLMCRQDCCDQTLKPVQQRIAWTSKTVLNRPGWCGGIQRKRIVGENHKPPCATRVWKDPSFFFWGGAQGFLSAMS